MESRIYYDNGNAIKVGYNYLNFYDTPFDFLTNKISLNNYIFTGSESNLELIGYTETYGATKDTKGTFFAPVYRQKFVKGKELSNKQQSMLDNEMLQRGFKKVDKDTFVSKDYVIKDLHTDNVIVDDNRNLHFIDTVPFLNTPEEGFGGSREYNKGNLKKITQNAAGTSNNVSSNPSTSLQKLSENMTEVADKSSQDVSDYNRYLMRKRAVDRSREEGKEPNPDTLKDVEESKFNGAYVMDMGRPTEILQKMGVPDLPITIIAGYLKTKIVNDPIHNLKLKNLKELVRAVHNPIGVFENSEKGVKHNDRLELFTSMENDKGEPVMVILQLERVINKKDKYGMQEQLRVNGIKTAFAIGHNNYRLGDKISGNHTLFINKKRVLPYLQGMESQLVDLKYDENSNQIIINQKRGFRNPKEKSDFTKVQKIVEKVNAFDNKTTPDEVRFQKEITDGVIANGATEQDILNQEEVGDDIELLPHWHKCSPP